MLDVWKAADDTDVFESAFDFDHFEPISSTAPAHALEDGRCWLPWPASPASTSASTTFATTSCPRPQPRHPNRYVDMGDMPDDELFPALELSGSDVIPQCA